MVLGHSPWGRLQDLKVEFIFGIHIVWIGGACKMTDNEWTVRKEKAN